MPDELLELFEVGEGTSAGEACLLVRGLGTSSYETIKIRSTKAGKARVKVHFEVPISDRRRFWDKEGEYNIIDDEGELNLQDF